jgi:hypothetical protein
VVGVVEGRVGQGTELFGGAAAATRTTSTAWSTDLVCKAWEGATKTGEIGAGLALRGWPGGTGETPEPRGPGGLLHCLVQRLLRLAAECGQMDVLCW